MILSDSVHVDPRRHIKQLTILWAPISPLSHIIIFDFLLNSLLIHVENGENYQELMIFRWIGTYAPESSLVCTNFIYHINGL